MEASASVKERPILFSGEMVRAILAGRKTQTRRIVKRRAGQTIENGAVFSATDPFWVLRPYGVRGDRLWVREAFCQKLDDVGCFVYNSDGNLDPTCFHYEADGYEVFKGDGDGGIEYRKDGVAASPWKSPIHMPRCASRLLLEVVGVRVERLQSISNDDARAEGVEPSDKVERSDGEPEFVIPFRHLWTTIHGIDNPKAWDRNPWVWVIEFKKNMGDK